MREETDIYLQLMILSEYMIARIGARVDRFNLLYIAVDHLWPTVFTTCLVEFFDSLVRKY